MLSALCNHRVFAPRFTLPFKVMLPVCEADPTYKSGALIKPSSAAVSAIVLLATSSCVPPSEMVATELVGESWTRSVAVTLDPLDSVTP
jgi:hypothetical protein